MERWVVSSWNCNRANISEVVFEGSKDHCQQHARDLLRKLPSDMDCMAMSENNWKWCQQMDEDARVLSAPAFVRGVKPLAELIKEKV